MKKSYILFLSILALGSSAIARMPESHLANNKGSNKGPERELTEGCLAPGTYTDLDFNAVKALIGTGGDMWMNVAKSTAAYEIPKGSGMYSLYNGSLWMGGMDAGNNLKLAAQFFRSNGTDFWTGPLTNPGASISPTTCSEYDKHFKISRQQVDMFIGWFNATQQDREKDYPGYTIPKEIKEWPAHGDVTLGQDYHLAPFFDNDNDDFYDPEGDGDYPLYDVKGQFECGKRKIRLYGDYTLWWVFNDKGNVHTQTGGAPIGMEIRAQAFAFATNDEVNLMTFYNYELVNRSTYTLFDTYFAQWVDCDLGFANDDYVGCDVQRGLGYCYNGDAEDGPGQFAYGVQPPAVGIDFFEGPYQDNDGIANAIGIGENEALNGIGYGDTIVDNERYGMRRFLYHNIGGGATGDPSNAPDFYSYMKGYWRDATVMQYGGNGYQTGGPQADFMFPGDTDPLGWGTDGIPQANWTEETAGNSPNDRRFIQSAGPFTLQPGAVNDITVGVPWARAISGGPFESVKLLQRVDDKAQALFDNCFKILSGPDAPDLTIQEMDRELIVYITNSKLSNNYLEQYEEIDPFIPPQFGDRKYRFQGYQVYQLKDISVTPSDLTDADKAQLVFQTDKKDSIETLINYTIEDGINVGKYMVRNVANAGLTHSFRVTEDKFAKGDKRLVNHKTYYFMALAYAYNNYETYDPSDPLKLTGQKKPYLASRKGAVSSLKTYSGIPHIISVENGGTIANSTYGSMPQITRHEGTGNGGNFLELTDASKASVLSSTTGRTGNLTYKPGFGPIKVQVIDPLNVTPDSFVVKFVDPTATDLTDSKWVLINQTSGKVDSSEKSIEVGNEQLFLNYGISISIEQSPGPGEVDADNKLKQLAPVIGATMEFADSSKQWLTGLPDADGGGAQNWIRSGTVPDVDYEGVDDKQQFERVLGGTWAPYRLVAHQDPAATQDTDIVQGAPGLEAFHTLTDIRNLASVDIVITSNKDLWTRCPVIEMADPNTPYEGGPNVRKFDMRLAQSVDKEGNPEGPTTRGMGWFPGYAINVETGERLNMAFGEDSWLGADNGVDMKWNPTSTSFSRFGDPIFGGKHYIYVFGHNTDEFRSNKKEFVPAYDGGKYLDSLFSLNSYKPGSSDMRKIWRDAMWVNIPLLAEGEEFLSTDVTIKLRVTKPYKVYATGPKIGPGPNLTVGETYYNLYSAITQPSGNIAVNNTFVAETTTLAPATGNNFAAVLGTINKGLPMYSFNMKDFAAENGNDMTAEDALELIRVVPNPYYAASYYETSQLDNRVKITNLPKTCTISIYSLNGTLIRTLTKDTEAKTSLDWDLKNNAGVPISGGVYIFHVDAPGIGEKVVKWFGVLRPTDLQNF